MDLLTTQSLPIRSRVDRDHASIVLTVSASYLRIQEHLSPEHLLMYFFTKCCINRTTWSPKKGNSVHGTFVQSISPWNDHGKV
jgi:hypothetical protein